MLGIALALSSACNVSFSSRPAGNPAAGVQVNSAGQNVTIACADQTASIGGRNNTVTLTGSCPTVEIAGSTNVVTLEAVDRIEISGTGNVVTWQRAIQRSEPSITTTGAGNTVRKGS